LAGICSRREADKLIANGQIIVNKEVVTEMGYQISKTDEVKYGSKVLRPEKMVYILLNKPKDYITTTSDPENRRTVMELVSNACSERIFPVGRLDRNTTGLLLFTNDGELSERLAHPSFVVRKSYQLVLDKPIKAEDYQQLLVDGVMLEDGLAKPDKMEVMSVDNTVLSIEIHSGKNRIVRRMFEHLGYEVLMLDRAAYAGLSKKGIPRGKWRMLDPKEVIFLKYLK
jgi:23S rRNA pseudouridine2605 synthase